MKMTKTILWTALTLLSCELQASPDFTKDIAPIFREYCAGCHSGADPDGEFSVETFMSLKGGGESGKAIVDGDVQSSLLMRLVNGEEKPKMPPRREPQLSDAQKALLNDWVKAGARGPKEGEPLTLMTDLNVPEVKSGQGADDAITALELSPDGKTMVVGRYGAVDLLDAKTSKRIKRFEGHPGKVNAAHFSKDGTKLIVASGITGLSGKAVLWEIASGKKLAEFGEGHADVLFDAELSPSGKLIATAGYDRFIRFWNVADGNLIRVIEAHNGAIFDLAFNKDGSILASASGDETSKLWRVSDGERLDTLNQPQAEQFTVLFTPDDKYVLSAGADNRIRMWQLVSRGKPQINPLIHSRFAHEDDILQMATDPKGRWLMTSSADRSLKLWTLPDVGQRRMWDKQPDVAFALSVESSGSAVRLARMNNSMDRIKITPADLKPREIKGRDLAATTVMFDGDLKELSEKEPNNEPGKAQSISLPQVVKGMIGEMDDTDIFAFDAKAGQEWMFDVEAARKKSKLDSKLEILDAKGAPVLQVNLQAVRDSWLTFRGKDSYTAGDFRVHNWREMDLNEYLFVNGEVVKLFLYPRGPDSGFKVYPGFDRRHNYFGTTAKAHPLGQNCFIVQPLAPGTEPVPNGLPVFPIYYENDDESQRRWGNDSQLRLQAPADGRYMVKISDVRGFGGKDFHYTLTARPRTPDFEVKIAGANPKVGAGSGKEFELRVERKDGFEGPIEVVVENLPTGFTSSSPVVIEQGHFKAWGVINAATNAVAPTAEMKGQSRLIAKAMIQGREVSKEIGTFGDIKLEKTPKVTVAILPDGESGRPLVADGKPLELTIHPGETITAVARVQRREFKPRIALGKEDSGRNLPHGVYVDNIGLNGLLIVEGETERQFFITAAKWVPESTRSFHLVAGVEGNQASLPVILHVKHRKDMAEK